MATYYAYKTFIEKIKGYKSVTRMTDEQYEFDLGDKTVYVLWCDSGDCALPSGIAGVVKITDSQGNEQTMDVGQIRLAESPVFIEK